MFRNKNYRKWQNTASEAGCEVSDEEDSDNDAAPNPTKDLMILSDYAPTSDKELAETSGEGKCTKPTPISSAIRKCSSSSNTSKYTPSTLPTRPLHYQWNARLQIHPTRLSLIATITNPTTTTNSILRPLEIILNN
jgi:hypothetical protein